MPPDRGFDRAAGSAGCSRDDREVDLRHLTLGELPRQHLMRQVIFRHDQTTGRVFIEPVDNAGPLFSADPGEVGAMMQERVDKRVRLIARSRMHHQAGRFIQHEKVVVLEQNLEWDFLRPGLDLVGRWNFQPDEIPATNDFPCPHFSAPQLDLARPDQRLQSRTRKLRQCGREIAIEPPTGVIVRHDQFDVLSQHAGASHEPSGDGKPWHSPAPML